MYLKILTTKLHRRLKKKRPSTVQQNLSNLGFFGLLAGRDLYRSTPAVTRELGLKVSSEGPWHFVALYDKQGERRTYIFHWQCMYTLYYTSSL